MFKTLTATVLAATIALTGTTTTATAASDADRIAGLIFGAAALAIIAKSVDGRNNRHKETVSRPADNAEVIRPHNNHRYKRKHHRKHIRTVPKRCERKVNTRNGNRRVFAVPCLNRHGHSARLPLKCLRLVEMRRGTIEAYGKRCLLNNGVRIRG